MPGFIVVACNTNSPIAGDFRLAGQVRALVLVLCFVVMFVAAEVDLVKGEAMMSTRLMCKKCLGCLC